jgi:hypothetical protein
MVKACLDTERGIGRHGDPGIPGMFRIGSLDPAVSGHAVFRVASYDYQKLYLLDGKNAEGLNTYEAMWDLIEQFTVKWLPNVWVIEGNNVQGGLLRSERILRMSEKYGFHLVAHQTGRNKQDDAIGVKSMASTFLRKEISIPWGDPEAKDNFQPLLDELRAWRDDVPTRMLRQDEVMALWFLHLQWQRDKTRLATQIDQHINIGGLPWSTRYRPKVPA